MLQKVKHNPKRPVATEGAIQGSAPPIFLFPPYFAVSRNICFKTHNKNKNLSHQKFYFAH